MHKGKGIIFTGCSFTWGGGLEYYAPFKDIPNPYDFQYDEQKITFAIMNFIKANRFSRLVANHFEMWEVNKLTCGGSDEASINFLKNCFSLDNTKDTVKTIDKQYENIRHQRFSTDEIEYVIFQLTHPLRTYNINLKNQESASDIFSNWEEMENHFISKNLQDVIEIFKQLEEIGIKCKLWSWHADYVKFIKNDEYLSNKFIKLKYDDKEFDCLYDLLETYPKFRIRTSGFLLNGKEIPDDHQTIECHKIIADSIISYLKND